MTINDFEKDFDKKILNRGLDYYNNGAVMNIEKVSEREYQAQIEGSEVYEISIVFDKNNVIEFTDCDCPYDDPFCKHVAAVLYKLRAMQRSGKNFRKTIPLSEMIKKCSKEQLEKIILDHADEDKLFRDQLKILLSENTGIDDILNNYKKAVIMYSNEKCDILKVMSAYKLLTGYIEGSADPIDRIKSNALTIKYFEDIITDENRFDDDIENFYSALENSSKSIAKDCGDIIASENDKNIQDSWEMLISMWDGEHYYTDEDMLFDGLIQYCKFPQYRSELISQLEGMAKDNVSHDTDIATGKIYRIIKEYGPEADRQSFIEDHISNSTYREIAINDAIRSGKLEKAEKLALDGEKKDKKYRGLLLQWMEMRYRIYSAMHDDKKREQVCCQLIRSGEMEYYLEWKQLIPQDKLSGKIEELLKTSDREAYEQIVVQEKMTDRLLEICRNQNVKIESYYPIFINTAEEKQASEIYTDYLRNTIRRASERSEYRRFCDMLKKYSSDCGTKAANKLAKELKAEYCKRTAFLDELDKAGF